jgi:hypothetical protein
VRAGAAAGTASTRTKPARSNFTAENLAEGM